MNRSKSILLILGVCVLASCFPFRTPLNEKVCTLHKERFSSEIAIFYDDKNEVETLEYTYYQKMDKKVVASMSEQEIVKLLESVFKRDNNANISVSVEYDRKKEEGIIKVSTDVEDLSADELEYYGLKDETKVKNVIKGAQSLGYQCEGEK